MERMELKLQGMSCGHCVAAVRGALERLEGVAVEDVGIGEARVVFDPARVSAAQIAAAVEEEGYAVVRDGR